MQAGAAAAVWVTVAAPNTRARAASAVIAVRIMMIPFTNGIGVEKNESSGDTRVRVTKRMRGHERDLCGLTGLESVRIALDTAYRGCGSWTHPSHVSGAI
ncbi:hypothetical protein RW1_008_00090 [Rhodococcus wratislaviensis NBRC 100605]|uniref:Uncharacterized protein n=1 Tax=Rhodococcus wratislaviensis NBRC 100605 TaxID=1219028 RepID=X0Q0C6_RHOWR|nr:hypothetical protein RW1_008_00090 [Rhodococcus wratislaviensis NBRC 100605]